MKKWHLYIKIVSKSPKNPFVGAFMGFMGPKPCFYGSQKPKNLKIEFNYLGLALY